MQYYLELAGAISPFIDEHLKTPVENRFQNRERSNHELKEFLSHEEFDFLEVIQEIIEISSFWGIETIDVNNNLLIKCVSTLLNPLTYTDDLRDFYHSIQYIKMTFEGARKEIGDRIALLTDEESPRLREAFNCYVNELNYSTIIMSVSAIESRLLSLMQFKKPDAKLEKLPLGELIREYLVNKKSYGNILPSKYLYLLQYCNKYRIFSVHPKKEKINRSNAKIILGMTCSFLFDKELKAKILKQG